MHSFGVTTVKTRKPHTCFHCGTEIEKGQKASTWASVYDGGIERLYMHPDCYEDALDCYYPGEPMTFAIYHRCRESPQFPPAT